MRRFGFQLLVVAGFVGGLGAVTASPAVAYCRDCGPGGCYDVGKGVTGYTYCGIVNFVCRVQNWGCKGGKACPRVACVEDPVAMTTPEATMIFASSMQRVDLPPQHFEVAEVVHVSEVVEEPAMCTATARPTETEVDEVVIQRDPVG